MSALKKLMIVSNRLPCVVENVGGSVRVEPASGGLITALTSVLKNKETLWVGWPGSDAEEQDVRALIQAASIENCRFIPVFLSSVELAKFYYGFSNEIIWPLFHDLQSRCNFDPCYWGIYKRVNKKYAAAVLEHAEGTDYVWVHDYHLMLIAEELREMEIGKTLAYFHHIPFPSPDIFAKLPWRSELLRAMLRFDVLGFQTGRDLRNFVLCLRRFLASEVRTRRNGRVVMFETSDRQVTAGAFPISIDFQEFSTRACSEEITQMAASLRENIKADHCLLGVDRLDYTKGIPERLRAFELLLEQSPELQCRVTLVQIVVPSREDIPKYQELKQEVERLVTSINGRFTKNGWVPIQYVYRRLNRDELLAHYKAADVALVTPLKDGMNLVAKEFCAAHTSNDGVLIVSEFAGAAQQLKAGALVVNPNDLSGVANAIRQALVFTRAERLCRMRTMRRSIAKDNVSAWAEAFCKAVRLHTVETEESLACAVSV
jgi:trehalose 6-phosphate synthase/phosphatase